MLKKNLTLPLLAFLLSVSCSRKGSHDGPSAPVPQQNTAPTGDPQAAYGEVSEDDAKSFVSSSLQVSENLSLLGVSQKSAASLTAEVGQAPEGGVPSSSSSLSSNSSLSLLDSGCSLSATGDTTDADHDGVPVGLTSSYDCSIDNSANPQFWSWQAKGSWTASDNDDSVANSGGRWEIKDYQYSGKYKETVALDGSSKEHSYKGSSNGYSEWKKDGATATSKVRYEGSYTYDARPETKSIYLHTSSYVAAADDSDLHHKGTLNVSGFVRQESEGKVLILKEESKDLVVDSVVCLTGGFVSGSTTFTDAKDHKLVVTYDNCTRKISLDGRDIPAIDDAKEAVDLNMVSCKSLSTEGDLNTSGEEQLYMCENISLDASGVVGTTRDEKVDFIKNLCVAGRSQGATFRTIATAGRLCPKPEAKKGFACLTHAITFSEKGRQQAGTTFMGNTYTYFQAEADAGYVSYYKDDCEHPTVNGVKSTATVGTFIQY